MAYAVYRFKYTDAWFAGSDSLSDFWGGLNTVVLLLSSFTMARGVYYCQVGNSKRLFQMLGATLALGIAFVVIKWIFEYQPKIAEGVFPGALWGPHGHHYGHLASFPDQGNLQLFFFMYFVMTGMHALHMIIGFAIIVVLMWMTLKGKFGPQRYMPILFFGLYWHFVDIVWVFLFPMYYLVT
jgi:cytochrome c oxidase subunit 3